MNKDLHLYDLDFTLWRSPAKLAVIDKQEPWKVIYRIPADNISMMKSYFQKDNLEVDYNGITWYLNNDMWDNIKRIIGRNVSLTDIGISEREWTDDEILKKQINTTEYLLSNLNHLKGSKFDIGFLTDRSREKNHQYNINKLKEKVYMKLKMPVKKVFFVNNIDDNKSMDVSTNRKTRILLEHLIGYKIKSNRFTNLEQSTYDSVHLYDDSLENIESANNIQFLFEKLLVRTNSKIKEEIIERVKRNKLSFIINHITSNKLNPFITYNNKLLPPNNIRLFKNF